MADARRVQHPQGAITLGAPLLEVKRAVGRTAQRPIGLQSKRGAGKAMGEGGTRLLRRTIAARRGELLSRHRLDR
jgi:hypothetical protein